MISHQTGLINKSAKAGEGSELCTGTMAVPAWLETSMRLIQPQHKMLGLHAPNTHLYLPPSSVYTAAPFCPAAASG